MGTSKSSKLYLIGAGPGDPELLTLKAARVLLECDIVLYDRLVSPEVLAFARPDAELVYVGKHEGEQNNAQDAISQLILSHAALGKVIGRLKGGDPLVFGRGAEEWLLALSAQIPVELVPGVSSATSVPGLAGIPLTYRGVSQSFAVVTAHCREGVLQNWASFASVDTLVILMGVKNRSLIAQSLIAAGRGPDEPAAFIESGATPRERVVETNLRSIAASRVHVESPAVFIVGAVVALRSQLRTHAHPTEAAPLEPVPAAQV